MEPAGIKLTTSRPSQYRQLAVVQHVLIKSLSIMSLLTSSGKENAIAIAQFIKWLIDYILNTIMDAMIYPGLGLLSVNWMEPSRID